MIIMGGFTDVSMPTSATTSEPSQSPDTNDDGGAQDFAALLAAWFAPTAVPATPEAVPNTELSGGQPLAVTSDQQATAPASLSLTFQAELAGDTPALPASIFSETMQMESAAASLQQKVATAAAATAAAASTALPIPTAIATPNVASETTPGGFEITDYADSTGLAASDETTAASFETGAVKLAARVVRDILGETKPAAPPLQTQRAGDFSSAESQSEPTLGKPADSSHIEASAFSMEVDAAPTETAHPTVTTSPVQVTSAANPTAQAVSNKSSPPPIVRQTIDPLLELAQQTPHRETRSMRFHLHPEELGRVEVEVTRDAAGRVSASLNAERVDAANSLTQSIGHLREALEKAGVNVDHLNVFATPQFQNNAQGQTAQQQPSHTPRAAPADQLLTDQTSEEGVTAREEEKLLNLRA